MFHLKCTVQKSMAVKVMRSLRLYSSSFQKLAEHRPKTGSKLQSHNRATQNWGTWQTRHFYEHVCVTLTVFVLQEKVLPAQHPHKQPQEHFKASYFHLCLLPLINSNRWTLSNPKFVLFSYFCIFTLKLDQWTFRFLSFYFHLCF